ncbi:MAG: leucine-rich repeat protein [Clostridia bacterium]|nr:leucine-rich repeat protein [Clostridia bacterium]
MKNYDDIENRLQKHYDGLLDSVKAPDTKRIPENKKSSKWENVKDFFNSSGMQVVAAALALVFTVGGVYLFIFVFGGKNINHGLTTPETTVDSELLAESTENETTKTVTRHDETSGAVTEQGEVSGPVTEDITTDAVSETEVTVQDTTGTEPDTVTETDLETSAVTETQTETEKETETDEPYTETDPYDDTEETEEIPVTETDKQDETDPPETAEPYGYAPAYVQISCGEQRIYPHAYFKSSYSFPEGSDEPVTVTEPGADNAGSVPLIKCSKDDTVSVYYQDDGNVVYVHYWQYGKKKSIGVNTNENYINEVLKTAECGVYRFVVAVILKENGKEEQWEYPFEIELTKAEYPTTEIDGVIYADHGTYCEVSGYGDNVPENVVIRSSVDFGGGELPVRSVGEKAFSECTAIKSVTLPEGLIEIGKQAFWRCRSLQSINLPEGLKEIKDGAFGTCGSVVSVTLPDSLETLGFGAFSLCGLTSIEIPDKITSLNEIVFADCADLKSVKIGSGVHEIHYRAFYDCGALENIVISENNTFYHVSGNCIIETKNKRLIFGTDNCVIPDDGSVTAIAESAFSYRMNMTVIEIPASITKLEDRAFDGCPKLDTVYYGGTVSQWESMAKTRYLENQYVLNYQCTVICTDGKVEPVVETGIE